MKGGIRIRLARFGRRHSPVYNIVVAKAGQKRDGVPIEVIGTYNPIPAPRSHEELKSGVLPIKDVQLDFDRAKYWIGTGAQPSDTASKILMLAGVLPEDWRGVQEEKK